MALASLSSSFIGLGPVGLGSFKIASGFSIGSISAAFSISSSSDCSTLINSPSTSGTFVPGISSADISSEGKSSKAKFVSASSASSTSSTGGGGGRIWAILSFSSSDIFFANSTPAASMVLSGMARCSNILSTISLKNSKRLSTVPLELSATRPPSSSFSSGSMAHCPRSGNFSLAAAKISAITGSSSGCTRKVTCRLLSKLRTASITRLSKTLL